MIIQVCGYGFVGRAHALSLQASEFESSGFEVKVHDPAKGFVDFDGGADGVIIAVSTPMGEDGSCDVSNVLDCISMVKEDVPILIKSTISLEGWDAINLIHNNVTFSPEYLRAAHAMEDFKKQETVWLGGGDTSFWGYILQSSLGVNISIATPEELIITKYTRNSFLALKVAFFNQVFDLCEAAGVDYDNVAELVALDERIGSSHTVVTDLMRGFGGHCFPKDTAAFVSTGSSLDSPMTILQEALDYNKRIV
tara:strand:- start:5081 stop:5836 length:756 start_codon:yes stop_codon:yes gene_type:complete